MGLPVKESKDTASSPPWATSMTTVWRARACAAVDGGDGTGGWGGVDDAGGLFVFEDWLAEFDGVADGDEHLWAHADVVVGDEGHALG